MHNVHHMIPASPDTIMRRIAELDERVRLVEAGRSLQSSSVGQGGIRFYDGAGITLEGGSELLSRDSAESVWLAVRDGLIEMGKGASTSLHTIFTDPESNLLRILASNYLDLFSGEIVRVYAPSQVEIESDSLEVYVSSNTTGSAANVVLASSFAPLQRSTSARRYKTDVRDLRVNPRTVLDLQPRAWRDVGEVKVNPKTTRWHVGLVAEEVVDAGLGMFVDHDADGKPDAVNYDRLVVGLLEVVKDQQRQIDELTTWAKTQGHEPKASSIATTKLPIRRALPSRRPGRQTNPTVT